MIMQKITIILFLFLNVLVADTLDVLKYHVDLSLLGKVGNIEIIVDINDNEYEIRMNAKTSGNIAKVTPKQDITYISRGKIVDGRFVTDTFEKHTKSKKKNSYEVYLFDHDAREVTYFKEQTKKVTSSRFDVHTFTRVNETKYKRSEKSETLDHYSYYDTLSSLLNLQHLADNDDGGSIQPVGSVKKDQTITLREHKGKKSDKKFSQKHDFQKILVLRVKKGKKEYELLLGLDENGMLKEAVTTKSIFLIGEGRIKRSSYETLEKVDDIDDQ